MESNKASDLSNEILTILIEREGFDTVQIVGLLEAIKHGVMREAYERSAEKKNEQERGE